MSLYFAISAAVCYLIAAAGIWRNVQTRRSLALAPVALLLHAASLLLEIMHGGNLTVGITEALSLFAWQAAMLLWLFCLFQPLEALAVAVFPIAAMSALSASFWPSSVTALPLQEWKIQLHVVLSLFSAGFLTLAAVQAVTLALQDRVLHGHSRPHADTTLPPLQTMESVLFQLIALGFFMLSLTLVTGLLFVDNLMAQHLAQKTALSVLAWAVFGVLLWGRWSLGWRGRSAIRWTLSGYGILILAYFGSKLVLEQLLLRH